MSRNVKYQPPFPYFGGKSGVAGIVWDALGAPENYVEPFFGSGAVLFLRPGGAGHIETVNDADGFVANFWRAIQRDSDAVAEHADNPVNEADLHARHLWLLGQRESLTERLMGDPAYCDPQAAGWWCWGLCCWIGSGWCSGQGPWTSEDGRIVFRNPGKGVNRKRPHLGDPGQGVNRQLPHLRNPGQGVNRKRPNISGHYGLPGVARNVDGIDTVAERAAWLRRYLATFADRLRHVRVCCGDWSRVCGPSVTYRHGTTGVFLDPPYGKAAKRTAGLYAVDCEKVASDAFAWAVEQGSNSNMRIVFAGYESEHEFPPEWSVVEWKAVGGYGLINEDESGLGRANRGRERLWLSPHCVKSGRLSQGVLF